jgi:VWFA-related protein
MWHRATRAISIVAAVLLAFSVHERLGAQASRGAGATIFTTCVLLVGQPAETGGGRSQTGVSPSRPAQPGALPARDTGSADEDMAQLCERLKTSFRLATLDLAASLALPLTLNQEASVAGTNGFRLVVLPRAIEAQQVTYRVRVLLRDRVVLDKDVIVERGHRAILAKQTGTDGETAFVLVATPGAPASRGVAPATTASQAAVGKPTTQVDEGAVQKRPELPAFRSRVTLVPLDVRVLDRDGNPVTDLKQQDFTILEDGVPQRTGHFLPHGLRAEAPEPGGQPALRQTPGPALSPQGSRVFLIVLGRGRLQEPSKALDGLIQFVRERLLPQDQVALIAYDRATDFTTDHEKAALVLERFKAGHERIEALLTQQETLGFGTPGLTSYLQQPDVQDRIAPWNTSSYQRPDVRDRIDRVFAGPGTPPARQLPSAGGPDVDDILNDLRTGVLSLDYRSGGLARDRLLEFDPTALPERLRAMDPARNYATVGSLSWTIQDLERIFAGIEYLRYLDGEKHLVYVTEQGLGLPRVENDKMIAAMATDVRIAIDTIQTGGIKAGLAPPGASSPSASATSAAPGASSPIPAASATLPGVLALQVLRVLSELTGGVSSLREYTRVAVDRLDRMTRFEYLLGYYPSNPAREGRYRQVTVKVNRPDVTVHYRHGYYASDVLVPLDRRAFVSYRRVFAAGSYRGTISDIKVTAKASYVSGPKAGAVGARQAPSPEVVVEAMIDLSRVLFSNVGSRRVAALNVSTFAADAREKPVGESWQKVDLNLAEETYRRYLRDGVPYTVRVPVTAQPRWVKVVVYDYGLDLLGSTVVKLR